MRFRRDKDKIKRRKDVGTYLRILRTRRGWTLEELAQKSGTSWSTLSRIERGVLFPTADIVGKTLFALDANDGQIAWILSRLAGYPQSYCDRVKGIHDELGGEDDEE